MPGIQYMIYDIRNIWFNIFPSIIFSQKNRQTKSCREAPCTQFVSLAVVFNSSPFQTEMTRKVAGEVALFCNIVFWVVEMTPWDQRCPWDDACGALKSLKCSNRKAAGHLRSHIHPTVITHYRLHWSPEAKSYCSMNCLFTESSTCGQFHHGK